MKRSYISPRRRERVYKVVSEAQDRSCPQSKLISTSEERIHRFYDPKFKEEAFRITKVEEINVDEGDVICNPGEPDQERIRRRTLQDGECLPRYKEDDDQSSNTIVPESKMKSMKEADSGLKFERAVINNQEAFIVTSVVHLPFAKNDVISESSTGFTARIPQALPDCRRDGDPGRPLLHSHQRRESPFERADIILEREQPSARRTTRP